MRSPARSFSSQERKGPDTVRLVPSAVTVTVPACTSARAIRARGPEASPITDNWPRRPPGRLLSSQKGCSPVRNNVSKATSASQRAGSRSASTRSRRTGPGVSGAGRAARADVSPAAGAGAVPAGPAPPRREERYRSVSRRKLSRRRCPSWVPIDSGWNCTPHSGSVRWRNAISTPSDDQAVASISGGRSVTAKEW